MIRECSSIYETGWLAMRSALWPDISRQEHLAEMQSFIDDPHRFAQFLCLDDSDQPIGFIEVSIRHEYVNGTESSPVGFIEGLYVRPENRNRGYASALFMAAEGWAKRMGCHELASDVSLENQGSQQVHLALGFEETERVVYFRKAIGYDQQRKH